MAWDINNISVTEDVLNQIEQDLRETLGTAFEKDFGSQPMSNGDLIPVVPPESLGSYNEDTRELTIERFSTSGVFRLVSKSQNGTNVMASAIETMRIFLQEASGSIRIGRNRIKAFTEGRSTTVAGMNDSLTIAKGWKAYIEANAYTGDLAAGIQGLFTLPFGEYSFSAPGIGLTGDLFLEQLQLAISSHQAAFTDSDVKILAVSTRIFNLMKSKKIQGSGASVMATFLTDNPEMRVIKVPQFDGANLGADVAYLLPFDDEKLALVVDESIDLHPWNEKSNLVIDGVVHTALIVAKNPTSGLRIVGL